MLCIYPVFPDKGIIPNMEYTIFNSIFQPCFSKAHNIGDMVLNIETNFIDFGRQGHYVC